MGGAHSRLSSGGMMAADLATKWAGTRGGRQRNSRQDRATYTKDPDSDDVDDDENRIEKLVAQRSKEI